MISWKDYEGQRCDYPRCKHEASMKFHANATPLNKTAVWVCDNHVETLMDSVRDNYDKQERFAIQDESRRAELGLE